MSASAAPITTPGLRPLTTRERSQIQTFPATWDLCGNKSDIEQIIGNAVPCALGEFVGRALSAFGGMPHHKERSDPDSVSVFFQYENARSGDIGDVALEPIDPNIVKDDVADVSSSTEYIPCQPEPTQLLFAIDREKAQMKAEQKAKGFKGKKLVIKRGEKKAPAKKKKA